jgi:hypothetical protein
MARLQFLSLVKGAANFSNVTKRNESDVRVELTVTYKGTDSIDDTLALKLLESPAFQSIDKVTVGEKVYICMGSCRQYSSVTGVAPSAPPAAPAAAPARGKKKGKKGGH